MTSRFAREENRELAAQMAAEYQKAYQKSDKFKAYRKSDAYKASQKAYNQRRKEANHDGHQSRA